MTTPEDELTASARQDQATENWFRDPSLEDVGNNMAHILAVNSGNEELREALGQEIAASNSGRASKDVNYLARNIDKSQEAKDKSVADEMKSADLSASRRIVSGVEHEVLNETNPDHHHGDEDIDMPIMRDKEDMNPVVAAIYMALAAVGVSQGMLNEAMGANGPDDNRATLDAFYELAQDGGMDELAEYIKDADEFAMQMQLDAGMKDVAPAIGTEPEVTEPVVAPEHELVAAQQLEQEVALQGPAGPTEFKGPA